MHLAALAVFHEEIEIEHARIPHNPRLKNNHGSDHDSDEVEYGIVFPGKAQQNRISYCKHTNQGHTDGIAHITGTIPKTYLKLIPLPTIRTTLWHIQHFTQGQHASVRVHRPFVAIGAAHLQHTEEAVGGRRTHSEPQR